MFRMAIEVSEKREETGSGKKIFANGDGGHAFGGFTF